MKILVLLLALASLLSANWDYRYLVCKVDSKNKLIKTGFINKDGYYYFKKYLGTDELAPVVKISWLRKSKCKVVSRYNTKIPNVWKILADNK
jgi:hypothetical protein